MKICWLIIALISFFALSSCISDDKMKAGKEVTLLLGAEDYSVGIESSAGGKGLTTLKIKNFSDSGKGLSLEQITSFAATNFINKIGTADFSNNDSLKVIIENDTGVGEVIYSVKDVKISEKYYRLLTSVLSHSDKNFLLGKVDTLFLPDSSLNQFLNIQQNEHKGAFKFQFVGFKTSDLGPDHSPVVIIWMNEIRDNKMTRYTFYILEKNEKIIYIGMEDIKNGFVKSNI